MQRPLGVVAIAVLALACESPAPAPATHAPTPTQATTTAVPSGAVAAQTNDCPAHVQCHPAWSACRCTRNARGDVERMEADFDGDGDPDLRLTNVYDAEGNLLRWENDRGADGTVETPCVFSPPCPPPHPNASCSCFGVPQPISADQAAERLREAGDRAQPIDPAEAQRILDAVQPPSP